MKISWQQLLTQKEGDLATYRMNDWSLLKLLSSSWVTACLPDSSLFFYYLKKKIILKMNKNILMLG